MIARWLQAHLEDLGRWNADGVSRHGRIRRHSCGAVVVVALDGDRCAGPAVADPDSLTPLGEALAVLGGRHTYAMRAVLGGRPQLDQRTQWHIAGTPAGVDPRIAVVAEHRCRAGPLPHYDPPPASQTTTQTTTGDQPPF